MRAPCVKRNSGAGPADARAVWIFTNRDDPTGGDADVREKVITVARDAVDNGLDLCVWPLPCADAYGWRPFRRDLFFNSITTVDKTADREFDLATNRASLGADDGGGGAIDLDDILEDIGQRWKKMRKALTLPLLFPGWDDRPEDPRIMLDFYRIIQVQRKPAPVTVHQETNK